MRRTESWKLSLVVLGLTFLLGGCQSPSEGKLWVRSEVYFGLKKPDGSRVSEAEWNAFVREVVTPLFPNGLTIVETAGQWRDNSGTIIHEPSKMLVLLHPRDSVLESAINRIRTDYCHRFNQEAVMKVTTKARVAF